MSYHIVNIDSPRCYVGCKRNQLISRIDDQENSIGIEDVASIGITSFSATLHGELLLAAAEHGVSLILCRNFKSASLMLPANRSSDTLLTKAVLFFSKSRLLDFFNGMFLLSELNVPLLNQAVSFRSIPTFSSLIAGIALAYEEH
jgi:hypothetical protein